jgi:hypothetical protein
MGIIKFFKKILGGKHSVSAKEKPKETESSAYNKEDVPSSSSDTAIWVG